MVTACLGAGTIKAIDSLVRMALAAFKNAADASDRELAEALRPMAEGGLGMAGGRVVGVREPSSLARC